MTIKVQFKGLLKSPASWARVNRGILSKLIQLKEIEVRIQPTRGWKWIAEFQMPKIIESHAGKFNQPDVVLMFAYPPQLKNYQTSSAPIWNFSVYEASRLPPGWTGNLNRYCERVLVPSRHNLKLYRKSGVESDRLELIPFGYNAKLFDPVEPGTKTNGPINFLTVATPHQRKGLDLINNCSNLLNKYNLNWRVHLPYEPEPKKFNFWETPNLPGELRERGFEVTIGNYSDQKMVELYQQASAVIQPSRSEGFGLAILEGMAAGRTTVTSNWGGHLDFSGPGMIKINGNLRPAKDCQYDTKQSKAQVFEPDQQELLTQLKKILEEPDQLENLGKQARETVRDWTWERSAKILQKKILNRFKEKF